MAKPVTENVPASILVLDFGIYPRESPSIAHIRALRSAWESGEKFPPIVIDGHSRQVIDGFHRLTMILQTDARADIDVEPLEYSGQPERFLDAVRRNARAGLPFNEADLWRIVRISDALELDEQIVAAALAVPVYAVHQVRDAGRPDPPNHEIDPYPDDLVSANAHSSEWLAVYHADQLVKILARELSDVELEPATIRALRRAALELIRINGVITDRDI